MSSNHPSLITAAIAAYRVGNIAEAHRLCTILAKNNENDFNALHFLGVLEAELGNDSRSIECLDSALSLHPRSADIHADKGKVLLRLRRYDDALISLKNATVINPFHVLALHNLGCVFLTLSRSAEALATFDRLLSIAPDYVPALHNKTIALTDLRRYQEAIAVASRALELVPDYAEAFQSRGTAYECLRQFDKALEDFRHAASLKPDIEYLAGQVIVSAQYCCDWRGEGEAKPSQAKPSQAKPSQAKPSQAKPSQAKPSQAKPSQAKPSLGSPGQRREASCNAVCVSWHQRFIASTASLCPDLRR